MKGHTKIELTNQKTGEVKVIEDDNMFTNLLNVIEQTYLPHWGDSYFKAKDMTLCNYDAESRSKPMTPFTEFGGLLLFKERLTEATTGRSDNYYPHEKATMVGHASNNTYSGADLTRGSFNENLSSYDFQAGTATFVWDFNMEQGNGQIGTVCLCNHVDGQTGYGSKYVVEKDKIGLAPFYHHSVPRWTNSQGQWFGITYYRDPSTLRKPNIGSTAGSWPSFIPIWIDHTTGYMTCICTTLNLVGVGEAPMTAHAKAQLLFAKIQVPLLNKIDPLTPKYYDGSGSASCSLYSDKQRNNMDVEFIHLDDLINLHYNNAWNDTVHNWDDVDGLLHWEFLSIRSGLDYQGNFWFPKECWANRYNYDNYWKPEEDQRTTVINTWQPNERRTWIKLNLATFEHEEIEISNTTGVTITCNVGKGNMEAVFDSVCVLNNYFFIRGDNAHVYAINLSNNSEVHELLYEDDTPFLAYKRKEEVPDCAYNGNAYGSYGFTVNVFGDNLIINSNGGICENTSNSQQCIVNTHDFIVRKLSCPASGKYDDNLCRNLGSYVFVATSGNHSVIPNSSLPLYHYAWNYEPSGHWNTSEHDFTDKLYVGGGCCYYPMGLITINALDKVVTKTSDMTMRITYTITRDSPTP